MKMKVKTRVIVVVTIAVVMVDMMMMIAAPIVMTTAIEVMIAHTIEMIGVNPLVIEKMKMQTYSMRNMTVMWTIMMIEDDVEANRWSDTNSDQYRLINVLEYAREENA